jgi:hypothetical protein
MWWQRLLVAKPLIRAITDLETLFAALQHDRLRESVKPYAFIQKLANLAISWVGMGFWRHCF